MHKKSPHIFYRKTDSNCFYKVNINIKRITKVFDNEVSYIDYDENIKYVKNLKSIKVDDWHNIENTFFISKHFEWEFEGAKYRTTDKPIKWNGNEVMVFHNGKIWKAYNNGSYFPRIYLVTKKFVNPIREVLTEKDISQTEKFIKAMNSVPLTEKWTDKKYCRHFEKIGMLDTLKKKIKNL